jgi:hypothetical protein
MQECNDRHPKVSSPQPSMHLCKKNHPLMKNHRSQEASSEEHQVGPDGRYLFNLKGPVFPSDTYEADDRAKKVLVDLQREQKSRLQSPSLLVHELKELGMYGELSENNCHNMPFEDVHRLVMTMRMAELILNDRVQSNRKDKMAQIKAQLDADSDQLERLKRMRTILED